MAFTPIKFDGRKTANVAELDTNFQNIANDISEIESELTILPTIQNDITNNKNDILSLRSDISTIQTDIGNLQNSVSVIPTIQDDVASIYSTLGDLSIPENILSISDIGVSVQGYDPNILTNSDIGVSVQGYNANLSEFLSTFTLPDTDGSTGYVLATDGAGNLTFKPDSDAGGTVTSVGLSLPTGLEVSGSPITTTGTFTVTYTAGYSIPTTAKQSQWDTAYNWGNHADVGYLTGASIGNTVQGYSANLTNFLSTFTLPDTDGSAGYVLATDGDGNLTFKPESGGGGGSGTVTSVGLSVPTGLTVTGSPVTNSGTLTISYQSGYSIPTTAKQSQWDTAYSWGNHADAGYLTGGSIGVTVQGYSANLSDFLSTFTLPTTDGAADSILVSDGNGGLTLTSKFSKPGTAPDEYPLNQHLGKLAYLDSLGVYSTENSAPTVASAASVQLVAPISFISGTAAISTILAHPDMESGGGSLIVIPTGAWTTTTSGNISKAITAEVGVALLFVYDAVIDKWHPSASGHIDYPLTTEGDIYVAGSSGAPGRLPIGSEGQVLSVSGGALSWETPAYTGGTVTSVGLSVPTGLSVTGSPVTGSGTLSISYQSGYSIPTTAKQSQWDTAYSWGNHGDAGYLTSGSIGVTVQGYDAATAKTDEANTWLELQTFKSTKDTIYTITDGPTVDIDPANGGIQIWTLGGNRTPTATNFENGQSVTLMIDDGSAYTITWTIVDKWFGGAPTLSTDELTGIVLFKAGGVMYGTALSEITA